MSDETRHDVGALRDEFDQSFASVPRLADAVGQRFLAVRIGHEPFAVRLSELHSLRKGLAIRPLPDAPPALLGIVGLRGSVVPVYSLAALLGRPQTPAPWLLVAGRAEPVGLAVAEIDGHFEVEPAAIGSSRRTDGTDRHVREFVTLSGVIRGVVDLASVVTDIRLRADVPGPAKEN